MIKYIFFLLLLKSSFCDYICKYNIKTKFLSEKELINFLKSPCFFETYLNKINASEIIYTPEISNNTFSYPQNISYNFIPRINFIPSFLLRKTNVRHSWKDDTNNYLKLNGGVYSDFLSFNIDVSTNAINSSVYLNLTATLINKLPFVPYRIMDHMLEDFKNIFLIIY
jgi:hypothetical protein